MAATTQSQPESSSSGVQATGSSDQSDVLTRYRAVIRVVDVPQVVLPVLTAFIEELRNDGWNGTARLNPRVASAETALATLLRDDLMPGSAVLVNLVLPPGTRHAGLVVRSWPSVVTSVSTRPGRSETTTGSQPEAFCAITFRDPLTLLRNRTLWSSFAGCSPGEILGGVLSSAAGGDGRPTLSPVLPGMPAVHIREKIRDEISEIPYAIAAGEPMGYWLTRVFGRLGIRIEMRGDADGGLIVDLCDGKPSQTDVNADGGVWMTINERGTPSATNFNLGSLETGPAVPDRGALLDNPASGGAKRFGRRGPVETVIAADRVDVTEADRRAGFRSVREKLSRSGVALRSRQPGLFPGRVVKIGIPPHLLLGDGPTTDRKDGYVSLFGANEFQVADVSHAYSRGTYGNHLDFEKIGAGWRPPVPPEEGTRIVSGIVDDGESEPGELIERDRLGRIPVKLPFFSAADDPQAAADDTQAPPSAGDTPWPPILRLAPVEPGAGNIHGFVRDHRQGDWCKVAVVNPFSAEIAGFGYRDDRYLTERISDATMGMVVSHSPNRWRGMLFRPGDDEDLEQELDDSEGDDGDA